MEDRDQLIPVKSQREKRLKFFILAIFVITKDIIFELSIIEWKLMLLIVMEVIIHLSINSKRVTNIYPEFKDNKLL